MEPTAVYRDSDTVHVYGWDNEILYCGADNDMGRTAARSYVLHYAQEHSVCYDRMVYEGFEVFVSPDTEVVARMYYEHT